MTEKLTIKADQVVSRKGAYVSYIDEGSTLRKVKASDVIVLKEGEVTAPVVQQDAPVAAPEPSAETTAPAEVPAGPTSEELKEEGVAPSTVKLKPSRRGTKPKENADMATKAAPAPKKNPPKSAPKKAPAKKAAPAPRVPKEGGSVRTIGGKPVDISKYEKSKAPGGGTSYNNGDAVAERLQGKDLDAVYEIVAKALKVDASELRKKYKALNVGMQRMNLGNRLRKVALPKEK
jgi:hypothetical protein